MSSRLRVVSIASLFPDATRPNFGVFVERQLLEAAKDPGIDLTVIAPIGIPLWPLSRHPHYRRFLGLPAMEQWKDLTVYRPRFRVWPGTGGRFAPTAMSNAILSVIRRHGLSPDILDAQFFYPDGPAAMRVAETLGIPWSVKARGADISLWGRQPATATMVREAGQKATGMLAVSGAMKRDMVELGMPGERIRIHYTGLDTDRFRPQDRAVAKAALGFPDGILLSTIGALIPRKGQEIVIRALPALPGVTYALAGYGPHEAVLKALAAQLGVSDRVRFLGSVPHQDIPKLLAASDAMVLVSESEGLANAWLEALACGTPVVISDVGGAREVAPGSSAVVIADRIPEAVAAAVQRLVNRPPASQAVADSVNARFSWTKNARELVAHWRELAGVKSE